jgi:hypothetical protein
MPSGDSEAPVSSPSPISLPKTFAAAVSSAATKSKEALNKLVGGGQLAGFQSLIKGVNLTPNTLTGQTLLSDASTGAPIGTVGIPVAQDRQVVENDTDRTIGLKVMISQQPALSDSSYPLIIFDVTPTIAESRSINYNAFDPLHAPGEILKYKNTASRTWNISAKLVSRTIEEATKNLDNLNLIRSWAMPFYGTGTAAYAGERLGAPPPILTLQAYGENMVGPVKCVMDSYNWTYPNDIDYIQANTVDAGGSTVKVPFPVIIDITISLKETWSPAELSAFDLNKYRSGDMTAAYNPVPKQEPAFAGRGSYAGFDAATAVANSNTWGEGAGAGRGTYKGYDALQDIRSNAVSVTKSDILGSSPMRGLPNVIANPVRGGSLPNVLTTLATRGGPLIK